MRNHGLTALQVRRLSKAGRHADGGGLYLAISDKGAKSWLFMWKRGGVRKARGLGSADTVSLAEARQAAADARKDVHEGRDPPKARAREAGVPTFGDCADQFIAAKEPAWRSLKHKDGVRLALETYAAPLRALPVDQISTEQVLAVLQPVWKSKTETAKRLRQRIEAVLDYAKARQYRDGPNPAAWKSHLANILPSPERVARVVHHPAMPYEDVPAFMAKLRAVNDVAARCLEFVVLTAVRVGEARNAAWSEFDLNNKLWTIPASRMKAGQEHRVPLSDHAVVVLAEMAGLRTSDFVFPGFIDHRPLSDVTVRRMLRRLGVADATTHGFRSSFRDWAGDVSSAAHDVIEAALAHTIKNRAERAYRRGTALEKRRALMEAWASYCGAIDRVIAIRQQRA